MQKIAMVGLGRMGGNMARRLRQGGAEVVAHNRNFAVAQQLAAETQFLRGLVEGIKALRDEFQHVERLRAERRLEDLLQTLPALGCHGRARRYGCAKTASSTLAGVSSTGKKMRRPDFGSRRSSASWILPWAFQPFQSKGTGMPAGLAFGEEYPDDFMEMTCQPPSKELRQSGWKGSRDGYHPIVFSFAPIFWEDDFKGAGRLTDAGPNVRWLFLLKYPDGVSIDEGDAWFKEVFAPEVCANPEVNRMISSRQLDDPVVAGVRNVQIALFIPSFLRQ